MALDKNHIPELKEEIKLVEQLGNKIGYLVLLEMTAAIFRHKDTTTKSNHILKNQLIDIMDGLENENDDYYQLAIETLNSK